MQLGGQRCTGGAMIDCYEDGKGEGFRQKIGARRNLCSGSGFLFPSYPVSWVTCREAGVSCSIYGPHPK